MRTSVVVLLSLVAVAHAQDASPWIGQRVIIQEGAVIKVGDEVVDKEGPGKNRIYKVDRANGEWFWIKAEDEAVEGWVQFQYVIPYDQAIDYLTAQIRAKPDRDDLYVLRGRLWSEQGQYDVAIADYNEAIRLKPDNDSAWNNRGVARSEKKEYGRAIADFTEAIRLAPDYAMPYYNRANALLDMKEIDKAVADINDAIRLDPKFVMAYYNRGLVWHEQKAFDKAVADFTEAIRLDPEFAWAYYFRGHSRSQKKEHDKALADYTEAIRLDPKHAGAYTSRAWLRATCSEAKCRDGQKAFADASQAWQLANGKDANTLGALAAAYAECGDFDKAIMWQERANTLYKDSADAKKGEQRLKLYRDKTPYRDE